MKEWSEAPITFSERAATMFAQVSKNYPGSACFQAIAIAQACEEQNLDPQLLKTSLLIDTNRIHKLIDIANSVHAKNNATEEDGRPMEPRTLNETEDIITADFLIAAAVMPLSQDTRQKFLNFFPSYRRTAKLIGLANSEKSYQSILSKIIKKNVKDHPKGSRAIITASGNIFVYSPQKPILFQNT